MTNPPSRAPIASVARVAPRPPSSSSSSSRSSLPFVVAEDQRGGSAVEQAAEPVQVAVHLLGWEETELDVGRLVAERQSRESADAAPPRVGAFQDRVPLGDVLPEPAGDVEVVLRLAPRPLHLVPVGAGGLLDHEGVRGQQLEQRLPRRCLTRIGSIGERPGAHRQHGHLLQLLQRALGGEVEAADGSDVVSPPLQAGRHRHPEAIDVEDPASDAEFGDLGNGAHAAVSHRLQRLGRLRRSLPVTLGEAQPEPLQGGRHQGAFRRRARRGDDDPHLPAEQRLERLRALARDFVVRLLLAQRLALGIERHRAIGEQREIGEPTLRLPGRRRDHDHLPVWIQLRQPGGQHAPARPRQSGEPDRLAARGQPLGEVRGNRTPRERLDHRPELHRCRLHTLASTSSPKASARAAASSGPRRSPMAPAEKTRSALSARGTTRTSPQSRRI